MTHPKNNAENANIRTRNVEDPQSEVLLGSTMRTSWQAESAIRDEIRSWSAIRSIFEIRKSVQFSA